MTDLSSADQKLADGSNTSGDSALVQISQGALGALIGSAKRETAEKVAERTRQEVSAEYEQKLAKVVEQAGAIAEQKIREADRARFDEEQRKVNEKNQAQMQEATNAIRNKLVPKFEAGAKKYSDWNETVESLRWADDKQLSAIVPLLAEEGIENPEDILHHICAEGHIHKLKDRTPTFVLSKLREISDSFKNKRTVSTKVPNEPIRSLKPSHVRKGDGDHRTIEDFRRDPRYKC